MHLWGSPFSPRDTKHLLDAPASCTWEFACGCKQCGIEARASIRIKTEAQVIIEFKEIHKQYKDPIDPETLDNTLGING